ncbi:hypothetical protein PTSG_08674 [Salpingoeca rosetta]|uniref:Non-reducing end beta-L-arabinofuranosidase-like GH127 catalytic domain-containing protein n=1 Tax=Salpingoeca rosetta (strain ATCC 50818 / BSB-021) TaxID=946362 RepID=F2UKC8_SALR5|nr:uncharacterized protein PTSG_08674 [Salpingoeca rosetta]EGD77577.1 hypothetical protein PTSG_08674 [Salpingoeca rosetta]|eukprot:XP_004990465.1 hypothetical protein PTSG_08674 [Salpingoeca rosetta]
MMPLLRVVVLVVAVAVGVVVGFNVDAAPLDQHERFASQRKGRSLTPRAYEPLPVGSITPKGWFLRQLKIQAEGLSGHLALFWPDIMSSSWIGGNADPGLHERTPYWLNGVVPLAALMKNAHEDQLAQARKDGSSGDPVCQEGVDMMYSDLTDLDVSRVNACHDLCVNTTACIAFVVDDCNKDKVHCWLKYAITAKNNATCRCFVTMTGAFSAQADKYISYILQHQKPSGWLGPDDDKSGNMYWSRFPVMLSLAMYAEANPSQAATIGTAMLAFMKEASKRMQSTPFSDWSAARGMDMALAVEWLIKNHPQGQDDFLFSFLDLVRKQTWDWETWFTNFTTGANPHGVNNAQALKSSAVWFVASGDEKMHESSRERMRNIDDYYGFASGVLFCADELLCEAAERKFPSRGTELCAVVESMFSYNTMFSVHGDVLFADRAERIAYNALPATWASPAGGDMWNHQYLQALNEINAAVNDVHVWTHDGPDAETYGLAPNYGCCTANFNQGWSKFAHMIVFTTQDGGIAIGAYAPLKAALPGGGEMDIITDYPFGDTVTINVTAHRAMPVHVRIPSWAYDAVMAVDGARVSATAGQMNKVNVSAGTTTITINLNPKIRVEHWFSEETISVHRGALLFSLPITPNYTVIGVHPFQSRDLQLLPTTEWRYALKVDPADPASSFHFNGGGYHPGTAPFNHTSWAVTITAQARVVPTWGLEKNSAAAPPASPACSNTSSCGPLVNVTLVPFGGTELRISEMPWA